jgi:hypothetical protein
MFDELCKNDCSRYVVKDGYCDRCIEENVPTIQALQSEISTLNTKISLLVEALGSHWAEDHTISETDVWCAYNQEAWSLIKQCQKDLQSSTEIHRKSLIEQGARLERERIEAAVRTKRQPTPLPPDFKHFDVVLFADVLKAISNNEGV